MNERLNHHTVHTVWRVVEEKYIILTDKRDVREEIMFLWVEEEKEEENMCC